MGKCGQTGVQVRRLLGGVLVGRDLDDVFDPVHSTPIQLARIVGGHIASLGNLLPLRNLSVVANGIAHPSPPVQRNPRRSCPSHPTPHHKEVNIIMSHEASGNAMARGPPVGCWESAIRRGRHAAPNSPSFTIQARPQLPRADPGPSRVGPFSLLRTRRNLPITVSKTTRGN